MVCHKPLGDARYLLSPGDLYALHQMPEIMPIGISSLKIEGRYKDADYVALTTAAYRQAVDEAWAGLRAEPHCRPKNSSLSRSIRAGWGRILSPAPITRAWCVDARRAIAACCMGRITRVFTDGTVLLRPNRGACASRRSNPAMAWCSTPPTGAARRNAEEGGRLYQVRATAEVARSSCALPMARSICGASARAIWLWRSDDAGHRRARPHAIPRPPPRGTPSRLTCASARTPAQPLALSMWLSATPADACRSGGRPSARGRRKPATDARSNFRRQLGRLGGTRVRVGAICRSTSPARPSRQRRFSIRCAAARSSARRAADSALPAREIQNPALVLDAALPARRDAARPARTAPCICWCARPAQLDAALALRTPRQASHWTILSSMGCARRSNACARPALHRAWPARACSSPTKSAWSIFCARWNARCWCAPAACCTRSRSVARRHAALTGDFSLNAANALTADQLLQGGLARLTPTYDLNAAQIAALTRACRRRRA